MFKCHAPGSRLEVQAISTKVPGHVERDRKKTLKRRGKGARGIAFSYPDGYTHMKYVYILGEDRIHRRQKFIASNKINKIKNINSCTIASSKSVELRKHLTQVFCMLSSQVDLLNFSTTAPRSSLRTRTINNLC